MKVILTQDVRGQGKRGQMIEVSDGYARNFLLPRKLAQEATADNVNTMRMNDKAAQERQAKERAEALDISKRMKDMTVIEPPRAAEPAVCSARSRTSKLPMRSQSSPASSSTNGRSSLTSRSSPSASTLSSVSSATRSTLS